MKAKKEGNTTVEGRCASVGRKRSEGKTWWSVTVDVDEDGGLEASVACGAGRATYFEE